METPPASQHFHDDNCYAMGPGDIEIRICELAAKWTREAGMFGRQEAAAELRALKIQSGRSDTAGVSRPSVYDAERSSGSARLKRNANFAPNANDPDVVEFNALKIEQRRLEARGAVEPPAQEPTEQRSVTLLEVELVAFALLGFRPDWKYKIRDDIRHCVQGVIEMTREAASGPEPKVIPTWWQLQERTRERDAALKELESLRSARSTPPPAEWKKLERHHGYMLPDRDSNGKLVSWSSCAVIRASDVDDLVAKATPPPAEQPIHASHDWGVEEPGCVNCGAMRFWDSAKKPCPAVAPPPERPQEPRIEFDNHHNALLCPYCNPKGLKFAEPVELTVQPDQADTSQGIR